MNYTTKFDDHTVCQRLLETISQRAFEGLTFQIMQINGKFNGHTTILIDVTDPQLQIFDLCRNEIIRATT